jgi:hypothetical protein
MIDGEAFLAGEHLVGHVVLQTRVLFGCKNSTANRHAGFKGSKRIPTLKAAVSRDCKCQKIAQLLSPSSRRLAILHLVDSSASASRPKSDKVHYQTFWYD